MLKNKYIYRIVCLLSLCLLSLFLVTIFKEHQLQKELSQKILRFHVLANSNSPKDQEEKMQVKNAVTEFLQPLLQNASSKEETIACLKDQLYNIKEISQTRTAAQNVSVSLEKDWFPSITYGDCTFPAGIYDTLRITIGESQGKNWWCVLYPGLCFSNAVKPVATTEDKTLLKNTLSEECYDFLMRPAKTKIRFRLFGLEFFKQNS